MADKPLILVNALKLHEGPQRSPTGNFHHVLHLAGELAHCPEFDICFLTDLDSHEPFAQRVPARQLVRTPLQGNSILAADWAVYQAVRRLRPAIYHRPTGQLPFFPLACRTIGGVADLNFRCLPGSRVKRLYKEASYRWTVRRADRVVCVSEFTRQDVARALNCPAAKLRVIYHGANELPPPDPAILRQVPPRYWLTFAHQKHKNAELCLQALAEHRRSHPADALVLIGAHSHIQEVLQPLAARLGVGEAAIFVGRISAAELAALYGQAVGLLFLSKFEGFGLPVLEAMRAGCPVICSNVCSLPEVAGQAALMLAPDDLSGLVRAMFDLTVKSDLRSRLIAAGLAQARRFSWSQSARQTVQLYKEMLY